MKRLIFFALIFRFISLSFFAQEAPPTLKAETKPEQKCLQEHHSLIEFYEQIRMLPPAEVTAVSDGELFYVVKEKNLVTNGRLPLLKEAALPDKNFLTARDSQLYFIFYCARHKVILAVQKFEKPKKKPG